MPSFSIWSEALLQERLSPFHNTQYSWSNLHRHDIRLQQLRKAAILIPLEIQQNEIYVWLTKRSDDVSHDKGHVSFPGGMRDTGDEDAIATCLRESHEEVGLSADQVTILSEHAPQINARGLTITPIIGLISSGFIPKPNKEVSKCFRLPLRRFLSHERHDQMSVAFLGGDTKVNFFTNYIDGEMIVTWGLTAGLCVQVASVIFQELPEFSYPVERPFSIQEDFLNNGDKSLLDKFLSKL